MDKEELKVHIRNRYLECNKRSQELSYGSFYDGYMDCYAELEEKNADLKFEIKKWQGKYSYKGRIESYLETKLTEAKRLLKELCSLVDFLEGDDNCKEPIVKEAEQFLKDSEVEK